MRYACLLAALVGCYSPSYQDCAVMCATSGVCPSGLSCIEGVCRSSSGDCGSGTDDSGVVGKWSFRKLVTFDQVPTISNYPVLVRTLDRDLASFAQMSGGDIRFETASGVRLPHELERFVKSSGELVAWVNVPTVATAATFYMYYGNADAPAQEQPQAVWDSDYLGVWHLSDPPGTTVAESTAALRTGTKPTASAPGANGSGLMAGALIYSGAPNAYFSIAGAGLDVPIMTFEAWVNVTASSPVAVHRLLESASGGQYRPIVQYEDPGGTLAGWDFQPTTPGMTARRTELGTVSPGKWVHLAFVFDSTSGPRAFIDGFPRALTTLTFSIASNGGLWVIGGSQVGNPSLNGSLDEVRISKIARPQNYVAASYVFGQSDARPLVFGAAETVP